MAVQLLLLLCSVMVAKYCRLISLSVCLCVCVFVRTHKSKTAPSILPNFCACCLCPWLDRSSSDCVAIRCGGCVLPVLQVTWILYNLLMWCHFRNWWRGRLVPPFSSPTPVSLPCPAFPVLACREWVPLNPARGSGLRCELPGRQTLFMHFE